MADPSPSRLEAPSSAEQRSGWAFAAILGVVLLAITLPEMPPQALQGILWAVAGATMTLLPPEQRLPRFWWLAGLGFLIFSAAGFLPKGLLAIPSWRSEVEALGLNTGSRIYEQPLLAMENWAGFAVTAMVGLFLLGHRVNTALHLRLALSFVVAAGLWVTAALLTHDQKEVFGFFPNRNHTATLLTMAAITGIGVLSQAIRLKSPWTVGLAAVPTLLCLYALLAVSESRAGIVLIAVGLLLWLIATGFRAIRGNVGKAFLLLVGGFIGLFFIVDSTVKDRLSQTVDHLQSAPAPQSGIAFGEAPANEQPDTPADARILIYRDTLSMIRSEPWTGVGPGQFSRVFPQYRNLTSAANDAVCLHPESDWLMMVAETGAPATALLGTAAIALFISGFAQIRHGRAKLLRTGTLVAAALLCFHGIFDVPGHRVGLAWAGAFLLALSLRPSGTTTFSEDSRGPRLGRAGWRVTGLLILGAGTLLLHAQWAGRPLLPSARKMALLLDTKALYQADQAAYEQAAAAGRKYLPPEDQDPLIKALARIDDAIQLSPLDSHLHSIRGQLALSYDDKHAIAEQAQSIQRLLEPLRVSIVLEQAKVWREQDPTRSGLRWKEALRRATLQDSRKTADPFAQKGTFERMLQDAGWEPPFVSITAEAATPYPELAKRWAESAPLPALNLGMPLLLQKAPDDDTRKTLQSIQDRRNAPSGTK